MSLLTYESDSQGIGVLKFNNPENLNAMDEQMAVEFSKTVQTLKPAVDQGKLKVLIITGAGRAFSAGGNLKMLQDKSKLSPEENKRRMLDFYASFLCIRDLGVPLVAGINGHAIGAGLCLASACDIRVASKEAKLGLTFTKLGLHPGMGATYFFPRILGSARAYELLLTARVIMADEALKIGLVSQVVDTEQVLTTATNLAQEILTCGPHSVRQLLASLRAEFPTLKECLGREADCQSVNYGSAEFMEGVTATMEKRTPNFN